MTHQSEIDELLKRLGDAQPPAGMEQRVNQRLRSVPQRFSVSTTRSVAAVGLAASVFLSAVALNPGLRDRLLHRTQTPNVHAIAPLRPAAPAGGFGAASVVHVPAEPVPVQPAAPSQGRGRSRSGRAVLPDGAATPLPRGVAHRAPVNPPPAASSSDDATHP